MDVRRSLRVSTHFTPDPEEDLEGTGPPDDGEGIAIPESSDAAEPSGDGGGGNELISMLRYTVPDEFPAPSYGFKLEEHQEATAGAFFDDLQLFQSASLLRWREFASRKQGDIHLYAAGSPILQDAELISLIRRGIPASHRQRVWLVLSGAAASRAENPSLFRDCVTLMAAKPSASAGQIDLDLARTFPGHPYFDSNEGRAALRVVLLAYAHFDPVIGYCQGMNFLAGVILLVFAGCDLETSFWVFVMLMAIGRQHFSTSMVGNKAAMRAIEALLPHHLPRLAAAFVGPNQGTPVVPLISMPWWLSFYSTTLHLELALMVWDSFWVHHNTVPLYAASLALFAVSEPQVLALGPEPSLGDLLPVFRDPIWTGFVACDVSAFVDLFSSFIDRLAPISVLSTDRPVDPHFEDLYSAAMQEITAEAEKMQLSRDLMLLSRQTHFTRAQLEMLRDQFEQLTSELDASDSCQERGITQELFSEVVAKLLPHWIDNQLPLADIFSNLDASGDGIISFKELMMGLSILYEGSPEEKLRIIFRLFDSDKTGTLDQQELSALVAMAYRTLYHSAADNTAVAALFQALDSDHSGTIDFDEFSRVVKILPGLLEIFSLQHSSHPQPALAHKHRWYAKFWKKRRATVTSHSPAAALQDIFRVKDTAKRGSVGPSPRAAPVKSHSPFLPRPNTLPRRSSQPPAPSIPSDPPAPQSEDVPLLGPKHHREHRQQQQQQQDDSCCACDCIII
ncbi:MAG: EF-hand domain-containing protein [archaeon]|nr:EF-hand domain-containing protein [archaeon]